MTTNLNPNSLPIAQLNEFLPPISRWTRFGGLVILIAMGIGITAASMTQYKVTVRAQGTIRPIGELRLVQAAAEGSIMDILVKENQRVEQGDVIAMIDDSRLQTQKKQLQSNIQQTQLQRVQINAQINAITRQITAETDRISRTIASAEAELNGRHRDYQDKQITTITEVEETEANLRAAQASLDAAKVKRDRYESIARSGAIPQNLLEEAQLEVQQQEQAVEAVRSRLERAKTALNPTDADILIATERIAQEHASGEANLAALNKEREALIQQHVEMSEQLERYTGELRQVETDLRHTTITATADGIITKLNLRNPGQTVRSGEEIAQIVPTNASLEVKAAVSPEERSKLKEGQRVQMRVSACPYPDYGVLEGVVSRISEDTIKPESNNGSPVAPFYEVAIDPSSRSLSRGENQCSIQAGMEGRVDIISREETVLKFLLRKARLLTDV